MTMSIKTAAVGMGSELKSKVFATLKVQMFIAEYSVRSIENNNWKSRVITVLIENAVS